MLWVLENTANSKTKQKAMTAMNETASANEMGKDRVKWQSQELPLRGCSGTVCEGRYHLSRNLKEEPGGEYSMLIAQPMQRICSVNELGKFEEEKRGQY